MCVYNIWFAVFYMNDSLVKDCPFYIFVNLRDFRIHFNVFYFTFLVPYYSIMINNVIVKRALDELSK